MPRSRPRPAPSSSCSRRAPASGSRIAVELTIETLGHRGDGIGVLDGRRVFVPLTVPGDRVRALLGGVTADGVRAELVEVLEPGPGRGPPACRHFGQCGGCVSQHLDDAAYAGWKADRLTQVLARAGLAPAMVAPLARTAPGGRRRARFAALRRGRKLVFGFNARLSHHLVDVEDCPVLTPRLQGLLADLRAALNLVLEDGEGADVVVGDLDDGVDLLLIGPRRLRLDAREALAALAESQDLARVSWAGGDGEVSEPVAHRRPPSIRFGEARVVPPPGAFSQASRAGEEALIRVAREATAGAARVADLFAGLGTFSLDLAPTAGGGRPAVEAFENDPGLVEALRVAARGWPVEVHVRDLFADPLGLDELARFDALIFDPPRAGALAQARLLAGSGVERVVAVSCNPASFARDARLLVEGGYAFERVYPVDQFVWSAHLELVAVFSR